MALSGTLYAVPSFRSERILIAAQYSGARLNILNGPPSFVLGETNKTDDFLKKFPLAKVPAFETADGVPIFESNAIAHYVGNEQLRGKTALDQALIAQWIDFADNEILPSAVAWLFPSLSIMQFNKQAVEQAKEEVRKILGILNNHLLTRTYLVGERITQADITVSTLLGTLYQHVLEPSVREPFANVNRWYVTLINQPEFKAVLGDVQLCDKAAQFNAKKFSEVQQTRGGGDAGKKKAAASPAEKEKKEKASKAEKPKAEAEKPAEPEELDESDAILAAEPKSKDPFEKYPKGTFNMDDFKRVYSNESETVSVPYFWEKFDKENYSVWYCQYKYPEELTMVFMSCNLITGMFQRLDKMRKHAFGSMILFGKDNDSAISGIWVWRGHDLAFELSSDWQVDYESYDWKKLDAGSEETKKLVNEYFTWTGDFATAGGKQFNQGKIFK